MKDDSRKTTLDPSTRSIIDKIVQENNLNKGAGITILQQVQASLGYVSPPMIRRISKLTGITASALYSIATFYAQFRLEPIGKHLVQVCHGTACHLAGAEKITETITMETGAAEGHTSPDGKFTVEKVACLGCCSLGPVMTINETTHIRLTPEAARKLAKSKKKGCKCEKSSHADQQPGVTPDE
ncbi:NADH-quinone oxidoreductase subunit NuoE [Metallumcola ferriviriculae]|uniref:NADH-quinone oxidoreductase subunit NuoE n=1 Tax=Metallumcola ferriviriculae TaxID=3039180 RepID=A0AAU0UNE6_9FIRM|nr:NADH-quinone oxidoreductase subunit NuoE [Desulfitibacteraceae bacterium MK1]